MLFSFSFVHFALPRCRLVDLTLHLLLSIPVYLLYFISLETLDQDRREKREDEIEEGNHGEKRSHLGLVLKLLTPRKNRTESARNYFFGFLLTLCLL